MSISILIHCQEIDKLKEWNPKEVGHLHIYALFGTDDKVGYTTWSWSKPDEYPDKGCQDRTARQLIQRLSKWFGSKKPSCVFFCLIGSRERNVVFRFLPLGKKRNCGVIFPRENLREKNVNFVVFPREAKYIVYHYIFPSLFPSRESGGEVVVRKLTHDDSSPVTWQKKIFRRAGISHAKVVKQNKERGILRMNSGQFPAPGKSYRE